MEDQQQQLERQSIAELVVEDEEEGLNTEPKAPPPSPMPAHKDLGKQHLQHHHHRARHSIMSTVFGSDEHANISSSDLRLSFTGGLERSKSRTITLSYPSSGGDIRCFVIEAPDPQQSKGEAVEESEVVRGSWKKRCCKCLLAFTGDCAALCCCPCTILHLLAMLCIRLPVVLLLRACSRLRRRSSRLRRLSTSGSGGTAETASGRRGSFNKWPFGEQLVIDFPAYPVGFGDHRHWSFFDDGTGSVGSPKKES